MKQGSAMRAPSASPSAGFARHAIAASVAAAFGTVTTLAWSQALPMGHQVAAGTAEVTSNLLTMTVTNSPNAVINWQSFRVGSGASVHFQQANAASKVLNRVITNDPSSIMGSLTSNGSVWLVNPNGILFGQNAQVNVAGLVASTLDLTNDDFLAGRARFNSGSQVRPELLNQGYIKTVDGGQVWLVGGSVRNTGTIELVGSEFSTGQTGPRGNVTLASGTSVELVDSSLPNITLQVTGPNFAVENTGTILGGRGTVDLFGGIVNQTGVVRADTLQGDAGTVHILGKRTVTLGGITSADTEEPGTYAGSISVRSEGGDVVVNGRTSANGDSGGGITFSGEKITVSESGQVETTGILFGGGVTMSAKGAMSIQGVVSAAGVAQGGGDGPKGTGGGLTLTGSEVTVSPNARVDTSGKNGGGITITADGALTLRGTLSSAGIQNSSNDEGGSGGMTLTGGQVEIAQGALLDAAGTSGGGLTVTAKTGLLSINGTLSNAGTSQGGGQTLSGNEILIGETGEVKTSGGGLSLTAEGGPLTIQGRLSTAEYNGRSGGVSLSGKGIQLLDRSSVVTRDGGVSLYATDSSNQNAGEIRIQNSSINAGDGQIYMTSGRIDLNGARLTSSREGEAIYMKTRDFWNSDSQLSVANGNWRVFLASGSGFDANGFSGLDYSFVEVGASEGMKVDHSGNGILVSDPLIVQVRLDASREYDRTTDASFTQALSNDAESRGIQIRRTSGWTSATGSFVDKHAGNDKFILVDNGNDLFEVRTISGAQVYGATQNFVADVTKRPVTANVSVASKVYDGGTQAGITSASATGFLENDDVRYNLSANFDNKNVGTSKRVTVNFSLNGSDARNYETRTPAPLSASITPRAVTAAGITAADKVYDGTRNASLSGNLSGRLEGDDLTLDAAGALFDTKNVGTNKTVLFSGTLRGADAGNYSFNGPLSTTASITPLPAQIKITGQVAKGYDGSNSAALAADQYALAGILASDAVTVRGPTQGSYDTANAGSGKTVLVVGTFDIAGADAYNYSFGSVQLSNAASNTISASATGNNGLITPRQLGWSGLLAQDKVYDGNRNAVVNATLANIVSGDSVAAAGLQGLFDTKNAGTGKTVTVTAGGLSGTHAGNYVLPVAATTSAAITPRQLTAGTGLVAADKVYDGTVNASVTGALDDIVAGDQVSFNLGSAVFDSKNVGTNKRVTIATAALGGADGGNYVLGGPLFLSASITPLPVQVDLTGTIRKVYDGNAVAAIGAEQYRVTGVIAGDAVSVNGPQQGSYDTASAGTGKTVTVSGPVTLGGADAGNYRYTGVSLGTVGEITPRQLTLTGVTAQDRVYNATRDATVNAALSNVVAGDEVRLAGLTGQFDTKNAGSGKTVTVSATGLGGAHANNYMLPTAGATTTASITPRPITGASLVAADKVYDGSSAASVTGTLNDILAGDVVSLSLGAGVFDSKNVGANQRVTLSGSALGGADAGNYLLSGPLTASASILPRPVTIALSAPVQKEYDAGTAASIAANGYALQGAIAGDQLSVTGPTQGSFDSAAAGQQKTVSVSGPFAVSGADARNYSIGGVALANAPAGGVTASAAGQVGTITPAVLSYVADPATRDTAVPLVALRGTVTGFKGSDTLASATTGSLQWDSVATPGSRPGSYAINGSGLTAGNYVFVQAPGNAQALVLRLNPTFNAGSSNRSAAIASAVAATEPVRGLPSSGSAVLDVSAPSAGRSFGSVRIGSMNQQELAQMMAQRRDFKRKLFADAVYKLEIDPSLADIRPCASVADADSGACRISAAQLQLLHASQQQALPSRKLAKNLSLPQIERKIAVLIGINDYADKTIPRLENAVPDVEAVGKLFEEKLGYEVRVLRNSSKADIIRALNALSTEVGSSDSVIVYYAGHGYSLEKNGAGYWLPSDASANDPRQWISNSDVAAILSNIRSKQMAVISDSCYSGAFARDGMAAVGRNVKADDVLAKRSVVVLSSGGDEPVADEGKGNHSIFAWNLMQVVGSVSNWQPGSSIFETIQAGVKKEFPQTPKYGSVTAAGHQPGGDYLFEFRSN